MTLEALRAAPLFEGLSDPDLERLAATVERQKLAPGELLLREGDVGDAMFVVVSGEYLGIGLGAIALTAFMARETSKAFTATQFALFTSFIAIPRTVANASTGFIVEAVGWTQFFIICTLAAIPGMLLLFKVAPWNEKQQGKVAEIPPRERLEQAEESS